MNCPVTRIQLQCPFGQHQRTRRVKRKRTLRRQQMQPGMLHLLFKTMAQLGIGPFGRSCLVQQASLDHPQLDICIGRARRIDHGNCSIKVACAHPDQLGQTAVRGKVFWINSQHLPKLHFSFLELVLIEQGAPKYIAYAGAIERF